ncbi:hypothetical protein NP234_24850, partial [Salmonella enterica]|nr:hypothetical protein [Salmonella enterica]
IARADINDFAPDDGQPYDLIVSNPPYFTQSLHCPDGRRNMARHDVGLSLADLARACARLLAPEGRAAIILPFDASPTLASEAKKAGLAMVSRTTVFSNRRKPPRRAVCHLAMAGTAHVPVQENELTLLNLDGSNTAEYQSLARDFYLDRQ